MLRCMKKTAYKNVPKNRIVGLVLDRALGQEEKEFSFFTLTIFFWNLLI